MNKINKVKEIKEIYTRSGSFDNEDEIKNLIKEINDSDFGTSFEVVAIYVSKVEDTNILVELQVPTLFSIDCGHKEVEMVAYTFDGEIENYSADNEIDARIFNGEWKTAMKQMEDFANDIGTND